MGTVHRLYPLLFLPAAVAGTALYPLGTPALAAGLLGYAAALWRWPLLWLFALPSLLPVLDLSPLTGPLLLDEFDLLILSSLAVIALRNVRRGEATPQPWPNRLFPAAAILLWLSWLTATAKGLWPLWQQPMDLAPASHTPLAAWQVGKGLLWALLFLPLLRRIPLRERRHGLRLFQGGLVTGLVLLCLSVLWERHTFVGLANFDNVFRVTGGFSSMHTGGAYIETFIAFAFPALVTWTLGHRSVVARVLGILAATAAAYAMLVTFSRGGYGGLAAGLLVVAIGATRQRGRGAARRPLTLATIALVCIAVAVVVFSGDFARHRWGLIAQDLSVRLEHWQRALSLIDDHPLTHLWGEGFGRYPSLYRERAAVPVAPGSFRVAQEVDNHYLSLGGGEPVYLDQIVAVGQARKLTLSARLRAPAGSAASAALQVPLCEKALLYSFDCVWQSLQPTATDGNWQRVTREVDITALGRDDSWDQPPLKLSLYNPSKTKPIDIDDLRLTVAPGQDPTLGDNLLTNGDFEDGARHWLFVSDQDLAWHIHQQWVETYFAQGALGVVATALALLAVALVLRSTDSSDLPTIALAGGLAAFCAVGLLGSTVDTARLSLLFYGSVFLAGILCASTTRGPRSETFFAGRKHNLGNGIPR